MKCQHCNKEVTFKEVKTIKYIHCCGEVQVSPLSLRPKVQVYIKEETKFFNDLRCVLSE